MQYYDKEEQSKGVIATEQTATTPTAPAEPTAPKSYMEQLQDKVTAAENKYNEKQDKVAEWLNSGDSVYMKMLEDQKPDIDTKLEDNIAKRAKTNAIIDFFSALGSGVIGAAGKGWAPKVADTASTNARDLQQLRQLNEAKKEAYKRLQQQTDLALYQNKGKVLQWEAENAGKEYSDAVTAYSKAVQNKQDMSDWLVKEGYRTDMDLLKFAKQYGGYSGDINSWLSLTGDKKQEYLNRARVNKQSNKDNTPRTYTFGTVKVTVPKGDEGLYTMYNYLLQNSNLEPVMEDIRDEWGFATIRQPKEYPTEREIEAWIAKNIETLTPKLQEAGYNVVSKNPNNKPTKELNNF